MTQTELVKRLKNISYDIDNILMESANVSKLATEYIKQFNNSNASQKINTLVDEVKNKLQTTEIDLLGAMSNTIDLVGKYVAEFLSALTGMSTKINLSVIDHLSTKFETIKTQANKDVVSAINMFRNAINNTSSIYKNPQDAVTDYKPLLDNFSDIIKSSLKTTSKNIGIIEKNITDKILAMEVDISERLKPVQNFFSIGSIFTLFGLISIIYGIIEEWNKGKFDLKLSYEEAKRVSNKINFENTGIGIFNFIGNYMIGPILKLITFIGSYLGYTIYNFTKILINNMSIMVGFIFALIGSIMILIPMKIASEYANQQIGESFDVTLFGDRQYTFVFREE